MASLKGYIPTLARYLGISPAIIYERQRVLVREGVLEQRPGHGPGSGVEATPSSVALLLIGVLGSENIADCATRVRGIASAVPTLLDVPNRRRKKMLANRQTFGETLAAILAGEHDIYPASCMLALTISRTSYSALFTCNLSIDASTIFFEQTVPDPPIAIEAKILGPTLSQIANDVQGMVQSARALNKDKAKGDAQ
jgi:hypothetical protein